MISKQKLLFLSLFFWMNFIPVLVYSNVKPAHLISPFILSSEPIYEQETTQSNQEKDSLLVIEDLEKAQNLVHINDKKAFQLTQKALETAKSINQPVLVGKAQNALGNLHWFSGDYNRASSYYFDALKTYQSTKSQYEIGICYRNIAWIYLGQKKFKETEKYFKKSLEIMLQLQRKREILIGNDDLATLFLTQHDYKKGLEYSNKSLSIARSLGNNEATGSTLMTKGTIELKLKRLSAFQT
jgi:adenylate cyclase